MAQRVAACAQLRLEIGAGDAGLDAMIAVVPEGADLAVQLDLIGGELSGAWKTLRCR